MKHLITKVTTLLLCAGMGLLSFSCTKLGITDTSDFMLYYPGLTDIGPSTSYNLSPTYHGATPSSFAIEKVTLNGENITSECFSINPDTGVFSLSNTENIAVGTYCVTISCVSGDKKYTFDDIIVIEMMKPVPDGIIADPDILTVRLADILTPEEGYVLPTAKISGDGSSVSIKSFSISRVSRNGTVISNGDDYFEVSSDGVVSIKGDNPNFLPGKYVLDFKLTTYLVGADSEEGIFAEALTVDVTSEPIAITYSPASTNVEAGYAISSATPVLTGSLDGISYSIKSIVKNGTETVINTPISIDATTGVISVAQGNTLTIGDVYTLSLTAINAYGSKDFDDAYTITVVDYIEPITTLTYADVTGAIEQVAFENAVTTMDGESVTYSLVNLPTELADLKIDSNTGRVYAEKGHKIPIGSYTVTVNVQNIKSEVTATFSLNVIANPNKFTFVHWGNNLGLTPATDYASQYRFTSSDEMLETKIPVGANDLPAGVKVTYSVDATNSVSPNASTRNAVVVNPDTGEITFTSGLWNSNQRVVMILIVVTAGEEEASQISVKVPVFFEVSNPINFSSGNPVTISYTPFVFQVNPRIGGVSVAPTLVGADDNFRMDFRTNFRYGNINGPATHVSGRPNDTGTFMRGLWDAFYAKINTNPNYGQKWPLSYFNGVSKGYLESYNLGYVNNKTTDNPAGDYTVHINPGVWVDSDGNYANGVLIPETAFSNDGTEPDKTRMLPLAIWFDTKF